MRSWILPLAISLMVCGCSQQAPAPEQNASASAEPNPVVAEDTAPAVPSRRERLREIAQGERSGLWASTEVSCQAGQAADIVWHFPDSGADKVEVVLVGDEGNERLFSSGGNPGFHSAGTWLRPGMTFIARDKATGTELGRATIGGGPCEPVKAADQQTAAAADAAD